MACLTPHPSHIVVRGAGEILRDWSDDIIEQAKRRPEALLLG